MKRISFLGAIAVLFSSCNDSPPKNQIKNYTAEKKIFFPVTTYIRGQFLDIIKRGINPIKYTTIDNRTDSVWLKTNQIEDAIREFLSPEIDSTNLIDLFTEKKFLDQTIDAYTFTYDPVNKLPNTIPIQHWDVYISPVTGNIKRIYIVKTSINNKTLQLTWQSNKWCKIVTIKNMKDGNSVIEKEEKINWEF